MILLLWDILLAAVALVLFGLSLRSYIYTARTKRRLIAFAARAWRRKREAEWSLKCRTESFEQQEKAFDQRANVRAARLRKTWDTYEVQEALELAGKRLLENRPCKDEHALVHRCFVL